MKRFIFLTIVCFLLLTSKSFGQAESYTSVHYAVSFGMGDMGDYISKASWRGVSVDYRRAINNNLLVGFEAGWHVFYEKKDYDTYTVGIESLSGIQFRYQNEVPILATADYLITSDSPLMPYVGLGIGTIYSERNTDMGLYRLQENPWQFALKGELGVLYKVNYSTSVKFAVKYYNGFKTNALDNQGYLSLNLGMAWDM